MRDNKIIEWLLNDQIKCVYYLLSSFKRIVLCKFGCAIFLIVDHSCNGDFSDVIWNKMHMCAFNVWSIK